MKTGRVITMLCAFFAVVCLSVAPIFASADAAAVISAKYDFTSNLTGASVANAPYTSGGVSYANQSKLERKEGADGGGYALFYPNYEGSNPAHGFVTISFPTVYFADSPKTAEVETVSAKYLLFEMDFATESQYTNGISINFAPRHYASANSDAATGVRSFCTIVYEGGVPYLKTDSGKVKLTEYRGEYTHLSVVLELPQDSKDTSASQSIAYVFVNGKQVGSGVKVITAPATVLSTIRINQHVGLTVSKTDTFAFDNVSVKTFGTDAGDLGAILANPDRSISEFSGSSWSDDYVFGATRAIFEVNGVKYSSVPALVSSLKGGEVVTVLADVLDTITIPCTMTIKNPNGYKLSYIAEGFNEVKEGTTIDFYKTFTDLTVKWHIGEEVVEEVYTSREKASFKGEYTGVITVGGVTYAAIGFSNTKDGAVLEDLGYVGENNCEFWLVYSPAVASVTHSTGTVDFAYTTADVEKMITTVTDGDVITLNSDITLGSYSINKNASFTLDLGGHTLTQSTSAANHLFIIYANGASVTVRNGNVVPYKNVFFIANNLPDARASLENVTIDSKVIFADIRAGRFTVKDSNIKSSTIFAILVATGDADHPAEIVFDNCNINATGGFISTTTKNAATQIYSKVTFKDSIATAGTLVGRAYCSEVRIENSKITASYLLSSENTATKLSLGKVSEIRCAAISSTEDGYTVVCDNGVHLARISDYYVVTDDCAVITWVVGVNYKEEAWVRGEIPVCPFEIPEGNATVKYTFPEITPAAEDKKYVLEAVPAFVPKMNLTLSLDFDLGVYIPVNADVVSIVIGGVTYTYEETTMLSVDGGMYNKYTFRGITPDTACDVITLRLVLSGGDFSIESSYELSILSYAKAILSGTYSKEAQRLAASVVDYIDKAYIYSNKTSDVAYSELVALKSVFDFDMATTIPTGNKMDVGALSFAVSSARLVLGSDMAFRFELNPAFTGRLIVNYENRGSAVNEELKITNGTYDGKSYVDIKLSAADMRSSISLSAVSTEGQLVSGGYNLYTYISAKSGEDAKLDALLGSLYSYSVAAEKYRNTK